MGEPRSLDKAVANGSYLWIENRFVDGNISRLSGQAARVYLYLVRNSPQGKKADPITRKGLSASKIGEALDRDRTSIVPALKELEGLGAIEKIKEPGRPNRYRLLETCRENATGDDEKTPQGCRENSTPPVEKTPQGDGANQRGTGTFRFPKSIKIPLRDCKKPEVQKRKATHPQPRPVQQPSGCGPRRV
jgi:DNA-binding MarR family transcriptional regulator